MKSKWFACYVHPPRLCIDLMALILPAAAPVPLWQTVTHHMAAIAVSIRFAHTYLFCVYAKSRSIFIPSIAPITMNNVPRSFAYFVVVANQINANLAQYLAMLVVIAWLYDKKEFHVILKFLSQTSR